MLGLRVGTLAVAALLMVAACTPSAPSAAPTAAAAPKPVTLLKPAVTSTPLTPAAGSGGATRLAVSYSEQVGDNIPVWVAQEKGLFKQNGLDVDLQMLSGATAIATLLSGQSQVGNVSGAEAVDALATGADLVVVATLAPVYPYVFLAAPEVKSPSDLRGKKVGINTPGSTMDIATRAGLKQIGLDPDKDVTLVAVGNLENRIAGLLSGTIQGAVVRPRTPCRSRTKVSRCCSTWRR